MRGCSARLAWQHEGQALAGKGSGPVLEILFAVAGMGLLGSMAPAPAKAAALHSAL